jgi:succinate dehydrogenase / fumarate reductase cytochrome b subunit
MSWMTSYLQSSIGKKTLMALSGLVLSGFTAGHLAGNLNIFLGPDAINNYAKGLHANPPLVWGVRMVLLACVTLHFFTAIKLTRENKAARPIAYAKRVPIESSLASRTMVLTGLMLFAFIVYHLAHYTLHTVSYTGPHTTAAGDPDVYAMVIAGFSNPVISLFYIVCNALLGLHMSHGIASALQSLGLRDEKYVCGFRCASQCFGWTIALGNISIPVAVLFGFVA